MKGTARRERAMQELFNAHYGSLCRLAFLIVRDSGQAEESVMDAFLKTFTGWRRIGQMDRPDLYIRRAVVNACNSRLRRRAVESRFRFAESETHGWDVDRESSIVVRGAIDALPKRQRVCVILRYYEDMSEMEMAEVLECSPGTIKSQLSKAREKLKTALDADAPEPVRGETRG
ncbi:MAG: SigE family RNA polymerase sigma factor [Actinomycetota bacterium]|nr:SigE family RNA polymerase sigma factor [Actinomycetota bacterium]